MSTCKNCGGEAEKNYCPNCGQSVRLKRIDGHYLQHEIEHVLHFEKGIFYTVRELLIRPGQNIRDFLKGERSRLVKPVIFIIITSLIYSIITHFFHIDDGYIKIEEANKTSITIINNWIRTHYGYSNVLMGICIALWLKLFFRKSDYNFFEILILLCFVMGTGMLLLAFSSLIEGITKVPLLQIVSKLAVAYCIWAIGQFFEPRKIMSYVKALSAYLLGMATFGGLTFLLGYLVDMISKSVS